MIRRVTTLGLTLRQIGSELSCVPPSARPRWVWRLPSIASPMSSSVGTGSNDELLRRCSPRVCGDPLPLACALASPAAADAVKRLCRSPASASGVNSSCRQPACSEGCRVARWLAQAEQELAVRAPYEQKTLRANSDPGVGRSTPCAGWERDSSFASVEDFPSVRLCRRWDAHTLSPAGAS